VRVVVWFGVSSALGCAVGGLFGRHSFDRYVPEKPAWARRPLLPTFIAVVVITSPFYTGTLSDMRLFGAYPDVTTAVIMGVYVIMAIGLNIVVGYAGLLDLGYVAFYAVGAYTCAWFASVQFAHRNVHFGATGVS